MPEEKLPAVQSQSTEIVQYNAEQMEVIKKHLAPNCPTIELQFLVEKSKASGMNVIKNECYFVPAQQWDNVKRTYVTKWTVQTSIDFYRKRGVNTGMIEFYGATPYYLEKDKDGNPREIVWRNVKSAGYPDYPDFARATIKRKDMKQPIEHEVYWKEYARIKKDGTLMSMWGKMPGLMLCKVAEAGCWRKAVPELAGVYINDEMPPPEKPLESSGRSQAENKSHQVKKRVTGRIDQAETPEDVQEAVAEEVPESLTAADREEVDNAAAVKTAEIAQDATPAEQPADASDNDAQQESGDVERMASILLELSQCNSVTEINKWHETHISDINALQEQNRKQINDAFKQRLKEIGDEAAKRKSKEERKPNPVAEQVAQDEKAALKQGKDERKAAKNANGDALITDASLRLVMKICYTVEDEKKQPYIKDHAECYRFIKHLFKAKDVKVILLKDVTRFIATFNNFKNPQKLMDLYCKFKNEDSGAESPV